MNVSVANPDMDALIAMIRSGVKFTSRIAREWLPQLLEVLDRLEREHGLRVKVVAPDLPRTLLLTGIGTLNGAAVGGCIAGLPGMAAGALVGAGTGLIVACVRVEILEDINGDLLVQVN